MPGYVIYEIVGRKVGCTKNLEERMKLYEQMDGKRPKFVRIWERLSLSVGDQYAGDREQWWRKELGYPPDTHYTVTMNAIRVRGQIGYRRMREVLTPDELVDIRREAGHRSLELGVGVHGMSFERRSEVGRANGLKYGRAGGLKGGPKGGKRTGELGLSGFQTGAAGRSGGKIGGRRTAELGLTGAQQKGTCENCGFVTDLMNLARWHGKNCKRK